MSGRSIHLIDRDELLAVVEADMDISITGKRNMETVRKMMQNILDDVKESPVVDAVPGERDIPKAPTDQQLEEDGYGAWGSLYGHCPNCKGTVYEEQNYCEKCGQRLNWGDEEHETD